MIENQNYNSFPVYEVNVFNNNGHRTGTVAVFSKLEESIEYCDALSSPAEVRVVIASGAMMREWSNDAFVDVMMNYLGRGNDI